MSHMKQSSTIASADATHGAVGGGRADLSDRDTGATPGVSTTPGAGAGNNERPPRIIGAGPRLVELSPTECLERVRALLVEIEALANAAAQAVGRMPFVRWPEDVRDEHALQARLNYDRVPFLVMSTAEAAQHALVECVQGLRAWSA